MSSVDRAIALQTHNGDSGAADYVDPSKLDANLQVLVAKVQEVVDALDTHTRGDDEILDAAVRLYHLAPEIILLIAARDAWQPVGAVACASTGNLTLSGEQTIDGVLTSASRVLVKDQTLPAQNGVYVTAAGAWTRATDIDAADEFTLAYCLVTAGTANASTAWLQTDAVTTLGTDSQTWTQVIASRNVGISAYIGTLIGAVDAAAARGVLGLTTIGDALATAASAAAARVTLGNVPQKVATIAALKALATTNLAGVVVVEGYTTAGDGGGGLFRYASADTTADDAGITIIPNSAPAAGRWNRIDQGFLNAKWYGCTLDGTTDDATTFQKAVTAAGAASRELYIPPGTLRLRSQILLVSNLTMCGPGRILLDSAAYLSKSLRALGTEAAQINLTVNTAVGDKTVTMASTTGLSVGQMVLMRSDILSAKYPQEAVEIESLTATTVTFRTPLVAAYATADTARIAPITPKSNIVLKDLWIDCGTASDLGYLVSLEYVRNVRIDGCKFTGHRTATAPSSQGGILINSALNARVSNCQGQAVSGSGNFIGFVFGSQFSAVNNQSYGYAFGIGAFFASHIEFGQNSVRGVRASGNRGLKVSGCYGVTIVGNTVAAFDSGIKNEDSRDVSIMGNIVEQCGLDITSASINCSSQSATTNEAATHVINGNIVRGATGVGIFVEVGNYHAVVCGNMVEDVQGRGILANAQQLVVSSNEIRDWGKGYVGANDHLYAGIYVDRAATVIGNRFHNTLTTVPSIALTANAVTSTYEVMAHNVSPTNDILWIGSANAGQINGITISNNGAVVTDPQRLWVGSVGGCAKAKNVSNNTKFSVTAFAEGMTISVALGSGKAALFFADYNSATVVKLADPDSQFDVVLDSANKFNVYKSAGSSVINFQNKSGSLVSVLVSFIGTRIATITDPA